MAGSGACMLHEVTIRFTAVHFLPLVVGVFGAEIQAALNTSVAVIG